MKKSMKINKRKKSSFRRKDKNLRKKTLKKYNKKSFAKGKKQKGGDDQPHVDQNIQMGGITASTNSGDKKKYKGGKRRKEIQSMFLKANKFANKYIEDNIERVSHGGNSSSKIQSGGISFGNLFNPKSEETIKEEEKYKEDKNKEENNDKDSDEEKEKEEDNDKDSDEEKEKEEEKPSRMSRFTNFMTRKKDKEDPIEPDLSEHDSAIDNKIMINKEKDKYVWIRVNIPRDKNVLVQSDTSGTLEETLKTFKELPVEPAKPE